MKQFILYTRVSTKRQGDSGLGLEAQERDIKLYFETYATVPHEVIGSFCDVESGRKSDRPELNKAIQQAKQTGATLLVSKLDRLSRSVAFIATLMEDKKLDLAVATMPTATKFQLHIYAALAEEERRFISIRTKSALAEAKARGVKLGGNRPNNHARHRAVKAMADQNALVVSQIIKDHRQAGKTYRYIAQQMNDLNISTAKNGKWYASTVRNYDLRITA